MLVNISNSGRSYTLCEDVYFRDEGVLVPCGFRTDFASVPKILWSIFPPTGYYQRAALLHDYLYAYGYKSCLPRAEADASFMRQMKRDGVGARTRYTLWLAVRLFGRRFFKA